MRKYYLIFLIFFNFSCQYFQPKEEGVQERIIARSGEQQLTLSSFEELIPRNSSAIDSAIFVEKFVDDWIKKQLMITKAQEAIDFNEARIQKKVLDYQYALMVHEYEQKYIDSNLNKDVSESEIEEYYQKKSENFILRQNLAKCIYFKIPSSAPRISRFRRYMRDYPKDTIEILEYANEYASKAFIEDSVWVKFNDVLLETPLKETTDKTNFLKRNSSVEVSDKDYTYFLRIFEYKLIGEIAPIEFIKENIADIIINKRKIELKKELEKKIYEEAENTNAFEIYTN